MLLWTAALHTCFQIALRLVFTTLYLFCRPTFLIPISKEGIFKPQLWDNLYIQFCFLNPTLRIIVGWEHYDYIYKISVILWNIVEYCGICRFDFYKLKNRCGILYGTYVKMLTDIEKYFQTKILIRAFSWIGNSLRKFKNTIKQIKNKNCEF